VSRHPVEEVKTTKSGKPTTLSKMKTSRKIAEYQRTEI
jgi:hypothetical protein